jgi:anaerobic selenocysteine-containing dehydrogenase
MERMGLSVDMKVRVSTNVGQLENLRVRPFDIKVGHALLYYPEANAIIPRTVDPMSRTPAFKSFVVTITPMEWPCRPAS